MHHSYKVQGENNGNVLKSQLGIKNKNCYVKMTYVVINFERFSEFINTGTNKNLKGQNHIYFLSEFSFFDCFLLHFFY